MPRFANSHARTRDPLALAAHLLALAAMPLALMFGSTALARIANNGLPYSTASAKLIQRQPATGSCHARGTGLYSLPDRHCTPGALNPAVTQSTIAETICRSGWTRGVRPAVSVTEPEKLASMRSYGDRSAASRYEYDHLVPLELGGAVNDARNLWPEVDYTGAMGFYRNPKDELENALKRAVCDGRMSLSRAQRSIASSWVSTFLHTGR